MRAGLYPLFFLSGISGLVYQVIWIRTFGNIFGNTIFSAALVTAVFMCGLGLGSYAAGIYSDRQFARDARAPLRAYAYAEAGIAAMGLLLAMILPMLEGWSAEISSYVVAEHRWHVLSLGSHLARYLVAVVLMFPATFLMGATLTLLIRVVVRQDLTMAGWRIGALYGVNTGGAALGSFLTDLALIPAIGTFATQAVAAALNLVACFGALRIAQAVRPEVEGVRGPPAAEPTRTGRWITATGAAVFLSGFAAMGMEMLWFRFLVSVLGGQRAVFSLLLTVILVGIWLGSVLGGLFQRRFGRAALLFVGAQALFALSSMIAFVLFDRSLLVRSELADSVPVGSAMFRALEHWFNLRAIVALVGVPAVLMGFAYPVANAHIQRAEASVGRRAGLLYLANTFGAVTGSIVTGFVLLPVLGMQASVVALSVLVILSIAAVYASTHLDSETSGRAAALSAGAVGAFMAAWVALPRDYLIEKSFPSMSAPGREVSWIVVEEGATETIAVIETSPEVRMLLTNGHSMSTTSKSAQRYMRAFSHVPLLHMDAPEKVLVICFGVGNTLHAASLHPSVRELHIADLSRTVLSHADAFARWNGGVLSNPRVSVFVNDGRQHLRMQQEGTYDLITLEPPPIAYAGVSALYSREFYALARSRLRPTGMVSQWLPGYQLPADVVRSMVRSFVDVFPSAIMVSGNRNELILIGTSAPTLQIDPDQLARRLRERSAVREDLERVSLGTPTEIIGAFAASAETLRRGTAGALPVTDDNPIMDHAVVAFAKTRLPDDLFDTSDVGSWCPQCTLSSSIGTYLAITGRYFRSDDFLNHSNYRSKLDADPPFTVSCDAPDVRATIAASAYLSAVAPCAP